MGSGWREFEPQVGTTLSVFLEIALSPKTIEFTQEP